jgi:phosphoglycerate dehydrogenase-like enzyme
MMHILVSERVARAYGARIRAAAPGARLVVPLLRDGAVTWRGDPARAEVCCFSEDFWQDLEQRRHVIPLLFGAPGGPAGVRWFHTFSAGTDAGVFQQMVERGVLLTNSSGASARPIAQFVLALMLHAATRLGAFASQQQRREWGPQPKAELTGMTAGIIGTGAIGCETARLCKAFGMRTLGMRRSQRPARFIDELVPRRRLGALLRESDFMVLACPLTPETEGMIGEGELRQMRPAATLINIARGRVVDERALARALEERWIAGACLDVFEREPLPDDSPLWGLDNVLITPHNAGYSPLNMERSMAIFLDNLARYAAGKPLRNVIRKT